MSKGLKIKWPRKLTIQITRTPEGFRLFPFWGKKLIHDWQLKFDIREFKVTLADGETVPKANSEIQVIESEIQAIKEDDAT